MPYLYFKKYLQMKFREIVEEWATRYKPVSHKPESTDPAHHRFFEMDGIDDLTDLLSASPFVGSPLVMCDTSTSGSKRNGSLRTHCSMVVLVKAGDRAGNDVVRRQTLAKEEALVHVRRFVAYLERRKKGYRTAAGTVERDDRLKLLQLEENVNIMSCGPLHNNWWGCQVDLMNLEPFAGCDDTLEELYYQPTETEQP